MSDDPLGQFTAHEIKREELHALMARSDGPGLARAACHLGALLVTGALVWRLRSTVWVLPLIVLHGANDTNVPVVEAEQVVDSLKKRGVPVEYVLFPDEGHGWRKTPNRLKSTVSIVKFFREQLK